MGLDSLVRLKHGRHALMNEIDRLEWTKHDLELDDAACLVPLDDVHTVDQDAVDFLFELEHCVRSANDLAQVAEGWIEEDFEGSGQVGSRDLLAALRRVNDRGEEHGIIIEQRVQPTRISILNETMPDLDLMLRDGILLGCC